MSSLEFANSLQDCLHPLSYASVQPKISPAQWDARKYDSDRPKRKTSLQARGYDSYRPTSSPSRRGASFNDFRCEVSSNTSIRSAASIPSLNDPRNGVSGSPIWSSSSTQSPSRTPNTASTFRRDPPKAPRALRSLELKQETELRSHSSLLLKSRTERSTTFVSSATTTQSLLPPVSKQKVMTNALLLAFILGYLDNNSLSRCLRVSRMWFETAANAIWRDLNTIEPLHHLLSIYHSNAQNMKEFSEPKNNDRQERILVYSSRIRNLDFKMGEMSRTKLEALETISLKSNPMPMFTSLFSATFRDILTHDEHDAIRFFISNSSHLRHLAMFYLPQRSAHAFKAVTKLWNDAIFSLCTSLESLELDANGVETTQIHLCPVELHRVFEKCPSLSHFSLSRIAKQDAYFDCPVDMLELASCQPRLERLRLDYPIRGPIQGLSVSLTGTRTFQSLKSLELETSLGRVRSLFEIPDALMGLERLTIWVKSPQERIAHDQFDSHLRWQHLRPLLVAIAMRRPELKALVIEDRENDMGAEAAEKALTMGEGAIVTYDMLLAIKRMTSLQILAIDHQYPFDISDRELVSLTHHHPNLRTLRLYSRYFMETKRVQRLSPNSLPLLAENCPELVELTFCIDTAMPYHIPGKKSPCWKTFPQFRALRNLNLGSSPIYDQTELYRLIAHVLPPVTSPWNVDGGVVRKSENSRKAFTLEELEHTWLSFKDRLNSRADPRSMHEDGGALGKLLEASHGTQGISEAALANLEIANLRKDKEKYKARILKLDAALKNLKAEYRSATHGVPSLDTQRQVVELQQELEKERAEAARARKDALDARNEVMVNAQHLMALRVDAVSGANKANGSVETVKTLEKKVATLQAELDAKQRRRSLDEKSLYRNKGTVPVDVYEKELKARDDGLRSLKADLQSTAEELEKANRCLAREREQRTMHEVVVAEADKQWREMLERMESMGAELEWFRSQPNIDVSVHDDLKRELESAKAEAREQRGRAVDVSACLQREEELSASLRAQIEELEKRASTAETSNKTLTASQRAESVAWKKTEYDLRKQLKEVQVMLANKGNPAPNGSGRGRVAALTSLVGEQSNRISELEIAVGDLENRLAKQAEQALQRGYRLA